jgi:AcrR family transcriptional regulator
MRKDPDLNSLTVAEPGSAAVPDPTAVVEGELAKSGTTRRRILDSARDLLVTAGYAGFSTAAVAEGAGLTRPAMLYHFPSRKDLLNATIHYLARRRVELFRDAMAIAFARHGDDRVAVRLAAVDITLDHVDLPENIAFQELISASRTDAELSEVVRAAAAYYESLRNQATFTSLPEAMIAPHDFQLVRDVVRLVTEGTARAHAFTFDEQKRRRKLRQFLRLLVAHQAGGDFMAAVATSLEPGTPPPAGMPPWPSSG